MAIPKDLGDDIKCSEVSTIKVCKKKNMRMGQKNYFQTHGSKCIIVPKARKIKRKPHLGTP